MARFWGARADGDLEWRLKDGVTNILSVGPFEETSNLERLVSVFANYLSFGEDSRLVLLGSITERLALVDRFYRIVEESGLAARIVWLERFGRGHGAAVFAASKLYISLDSAPASPDAFFDAMAFDVPIMTLAQPETRTLLGSAGLLVAESADDMEMGTIAHFLCTDETLRKPVLMEQRRRLRKRPALT